MQLRELFAQDASGSKRRPHYLGQLLLAIDEFVRCSKPFTPTIPTFKPSA
jgi:hypothetical protein